MRTDGRVTKAIGINGTVPGPLIRLREGERARLHVVNALDEESSIHWHGLLVPAGMDGVPGVAFPGIAPRSTFVYEFSVVQAGTYWYHSHSGFQEQLGLYGPIVIDPAGPDPIGYDREHVIVLSDHSDVAPSAIFRHMKLEDGYYDYQRQTLAGLIAGRDQPLKERLRWGAMTMSPTDISDATGPAYQWLVNGHGPADNWTALFTPGERVRLRIVNASSMTTFDVRIPGLAMAVVQADGQDVRPVETDEFQIGVAETYDVIVRPEDRAYTLVAETIDRAGLTRATLTPRFGLTAPVPPLRKRPPRHDGGHGHGRPHGWSQRRRRDGDARHGRHVGHGHAGRARDGGHERACHGRDAHGHARLRECPAGGAHGGGGDDRDGADRPHRRSRPGPARHRPSRPSPTAISWRWSATPTCARHPASSTSTSPATWNASCGRSTA